MKIINQQLLSITLKQGKDTASLFNDLRIGERISAKIIKSDGRSAEIEFRGKRIIADFMAGVPSNSSVDLILSERTPERIAFSIAGRPATDEFIKLILSLSVISESGVKEQQLYNLVKFLGNGRIDLLNLNLFLAGITKDRKGGKSSTDIFNSLIKKGVPYNILVDLSFLIAGRAGEVFLAAYYSIMKRDKKGEQDWTEDNIDDKVDSICRSFAEDDEALAELLTLISGEQKQERGYGEIPLPDGDGFSKLVYIVNENAFFFDINFSALGKISASIKSEKYGTIVNIFSDNNDIIAFLKDRIEILKRNLEMVNVKKPVITYYNSRKMIDKLDFLRTDFYIKRDFDVKI